jgi:hypothetical protein
MLTVPLRVPVVVGVNVTWIAHAFPAVTVAQVFVWAKSPVAVTALTVKLLVPLLVTVIDCVALVVLTTWLPKLSVGVDKLTPGAAPVPVRVSTSTALSAPTV